MHDDFITILLVLIITYNFYYYRDDLIIILLNENITDNLLDDYLLLQIHINFITTNHHKLLS